jgi:hypothetical protein
VARTGTQGTIDTLKELWRLLVAYARQETVDPLRSLGRSLGWGLAGAVLMGAATIFGALSVLRLLQSETAVFDENLSWLPYLLVAVLLVLVTGMALWGISRASDRASRRAPDPGEPLAVPPPDGGTP